MTWKLKTGTCKCCHRGNRLIYPRGLCYGCYRRVVQALPPRLKGQPTRSQHLDFLGMIPEFTLRNGLEIRTLRHRGLEAAERERRVAWYAHTVATWGYIDYEGLPPPPEEGDGHPEEASTIPLPAGEQGRTREDFFTEDDTYGDDAA